MTQHQPYESPSVPTESAAPSKSLLGKIATGVLTLGLMVLAYGAIAFWVLPFLPPNSESEGRLPSLTVMGVGVLVTVVGLVLRSLTTSKDPEPNVNQPKKIPAMYGVAILLGILGLVFFVITRL
ncbi:hypothetical protein [Rhodopirellula baltica]